VPRGDCAGAGRPAIPQPRGWGKVFSIQSGGYLSACCNPSGTRAIGTGTPKCGEERSGRRPTPADARPPHDGNDAPIRADNDRRDWTAHEMAPGMLPPGDRSLCTLATATPSRWVWQRAPPGGAGCGCAPLPTGGK
jgi:hypothetical protein